MGWHPANLSSRGYYAVMAMVDLATRGADRPVSLASIAERQGLSLSYLEQLFGRLRRRGLVKSVRGPGGGYLLSRAPHETRISEIFEAMSEPPRGDAELAAAADEVEGLRAQERLTEELWLALGHQIHLFLSAHSLADVIANRIVSGEDLLGTAGQAPGGRNPA